MSGLLAMKARTPLEIYKAAMDGDPEQWERALETHLKQEGVPFVRQFAFGQDWSPPRKYVADFAIEAPLRPFLVEVDGGTWKAGGAGHNRAAAYQKDRERDAEALCHGWRTLRVVPKQIESGQAIAWIKRILNEDS
jgi:very-short-patch-repair endonuclease